jgi:hypothetical protein
VSRKKRSLQPRNACSFGVSAYLKAGLFVVAAAAALFAAAGTVAIRNLAWRLVRS